MDFCSLFTFIFSSSEALNLSDSPPGVTTIKRERERESSPDMNGRDEFHHLPPPPKRAGFPASFYLPPSMAAAAAAVNFHYKGNHPDSDGEGDGEEEHDDDGDHNTTANSSHDDPLERQQLNGMSGRPPRHHGSNSSVHNDKSDDSAIENSPSTSAASGGNGHISPVSTKKIHLSKQHVQHQVSESNALNGGCNDGSNNFSATNTSIGALDALNLLSGMQFRVTRNGKCFKLFSCSGNKTNLLTVLVTFLCRYKRKRRTTVGG